MLLSDTTLRFANHAKQRITQKACKSKHKSKAMYILLDKSSGEYIVFRTLDEDGTQLIVTSLSIVDDNKLALSVLPDENTLDNPSIYLVNIGHLIDMIRI